MPGVNSSSNRTSTHTNHQPPPQAPPPPQRYDSDGNYIPPAPFTKKTAVKDKGEMHELKKFSFKTMKPISNFLIIGKRNCGKTNFLKGLLYYLCCGGKRGIGKIAVLSGSEEENPQYEQEFGIPVEFIRPDANVDFIKRLIQMQAEIIGEIKRDPDLRPELSNNQHGLLIIIDDLVYDKKFMRNPELLKMMFNGRHRKVCILIISQDPLGAVCSSRGSFDYIIVFRSPSTRDADHCHRTFFPMFPSIHDFRKTMWHYTSNYGFLISDNTVTGENMKEQYFYGRFPNMENKRMRLKLNYKDAVPFMKFLSIDKTLDASI